MSDNRALDAVAGFCVGDALGVPAEFKTREALAANPVKGMIGGGAHNQPAGTWSDDSSLTFCLMDSLLTGFDVDDIGIKFQMWLYGGLWTPYGTAFDCGITTRKAVDRMKAGVSALRSGFDGERDNGNGSLMRVLPLVFVLKNAGDDEKIGTIHRASAITHAHMRSKIACVLYVQCGINILHGMNIEDAISEAGRYADSIYEAEGYRSEIKHYSRIINGSIAGERVISINSDGYVVHTLEAACWCLLNSSSYSEAVLMAVNLGYDTDTTAAVVGGLAGLFYGIENIPDDWINALARRDDVIDLCARFNHVYR